MKIAIIDDGINFQEFSIGKLIYDLEVVNNIVRERGVKTTTVTHGTICAGIIKKYTINPEFISIKILSDEMHLGECEHLIVALQWCLDNNIPLVNISAGTRELRDFNKIENIANEFFVKGQIIVASQSNQDKLTAPACFDSVIGVKTNNGNTNKFIELQPNLWGLNFAACSEHLLVLKNGNQFKTKKCNSYATAFMTSVIFRFKELYNTNMVDIVYKITGKQNWYHYNYMPRYTLNSCGILINCNDSILNESLISYSIKRIINYNELINIDIKKYNIIFIVADIENKLANKILKKLLKEINKSVYIVYIGKIKKHIRKVLEYKNFLFWDESVKIETLINKTELRTNLIKPIYCIKGDEKFSIAFIKNLNKELYKRGYKTIFVSDYRLAIIYGLIKIYNLKDSEFVFENLIEMMNLDCLFFCSSKNDYLKDVFELTIEIMDGPMEIVYKSDSIIVSHKNCIKEISSIIFYLENLCVKC